MDSLRSRIVPFLMVLLVTNVVPRLGPATPLGAAFTYQGQLQRSGSFVNGTCDFQFGLFDASTGGTQQGITQTLSPVSVTDGLFTVELNGGSQFGVNAFGGSDRWLQIAVRCPVGSGSYVALSPRQQLTATPYALYAPTAGNLSCTGCVTAGDLASGAVTGSAIANGTIQQSQLAFTPVLSVGANGPLQSSGGQNPTLSLGGVVSVANGGTGASTAPTARTNLGAAASGNNSDITSLSLPDSSPGMAGNIFKGGSRFIHNFGSNNTFVGKNAGNFTLTGTGDTGVGQGALAANTSGDSNTAVGQDALAANTNGFANTAVGTAALAANLADNNTAVGAGALSANAGGGNTAVGSAALLSNTTAHSNTAVGFAALAFNTTGRFNTAVGSEALRFNIDGSGNIAVGGDALFANIHGSSNIAVGDSALFANTTGGDNTAVGLEALEANTSGAFNTAVGEGSLASTTIANSNTAIGYNALAVMTNGDRNTAVGKGALELHTDGTENTAVGHGALSLQTSGARNTAIGEFALRGNLTGSDNIAIGNDAGLNLTSGSHNIAIGHPGAAGESNTIRIGTTGTQTATYVAGIFSQTVVGGIEMFVNSAGQLGTLPSSARFKDDIRDMGDASSGLMKLRPVRFRYKADLDPSGLEQYGLVAEEVAKVYPDLVVYEKGQPQTVRYNFVNAMLLDEVQKQARQIEAQRQQVTEQVRQMADQASQMKSQAQQIEALTARLVQVETVLGAHSAVPPLHTSYQTEQEF